MLFNLESLNSKCGNYKNFSKFFRTSRVLIQLGPWRKIKSPRDKLIRARQPWRLVGNKPGAHILQGGGDPTYYQGGGPCPGVFGNLDTKFVIHNVWLSLKNTFFLYTACQVTIRKSYILKITIYNLIYVVCKHIISL